MTVYEDKMFKFVGKKWNPVVGCSHNCSYCWARKLAETRLKHMPKYQGSFLTPRLIEDEFNKKFYHSGDYWFVCDMGDLFCKEVPDEWILKVVDKIRASDANFLFLTKNPDRYYEMMAKYRLPIENVIYGATIESDKNHIGISKAPDVYDRIGGMCALALDRRIKTFICVEPIMKFTESFADLLEHIRPWAIAIGYDNYGNHLPEPTLQETEKLIQGLKNRGFKVIIKTLRKAWDE